MTFCSASGDFPRGVQAGKSHCQACSNPLQTARGRSRRVYTLQLFGMKRRPREASLRNPREFGRITKNPGCLQAQGSLAERVAQPPQGNRLQVDKIPPGEGRVGGSPPSSPWRRDRHPAAPQDGSGPREPADGATHKSFPRFQPGSLQPGLFSSDKTSAGGHEAQPPPSPISPPPLGARLTPAARAGAAGSLGSWYPPGSPLRCRHLVQPPHRPQGRSPRRSPSLT